ncbi:MAG: transglycosylase SLT domain-containing protein [Terriglobia bacterium]
MAPAPTVHPPAAAPAVAAKPNLEKANPENVAQISAVSQLIERAESSYTAGLNDYQAGEFEKAKQEFDRSLSVLLSSPYDIRSSNRLSEEFDMLADHINDVELAAIQNGNSLAAHQYVPTPLESFSGLTFPTNPNVGKRVQQEMRSVHLDLPLISNDTVSGVIAYLQQHARGYMGRVLQGISEYGPMISEALKKDGLPSDLLYLPGPESGFNPHATNGKSGAKGMWQLMRGTAALYGLRDTRWADDREDPYRATRVAAANLRDLYKEFGDWYLALAAYDSGPMTVQRAIERTGYADYWKLRELHVLPPETQNYVPIFLATALIAKDPQAYGFQPGSAIPIETEHVPVTTPTDLRLVAGLIGQPVDKLEMLNPALKGFETPPGDPGFMLNLPAGTGATFERQIAAVPPSERLWWRATHLEQGQSLESIALEYRVTAAALALANHVTAGDPLAADATVLIPLARPREVASAGVRWVRRPYHYYVRPGDNIDLIADRFDVSAYQIRRWNHLRSSRLPRGRRLLVYRLVPERVVIHHRTTSRRRRYALRRRTSGSRTRLAARKRPANRSSSKKENTADRSTALASSSTR